MKKDKISQEQIESIELYKNGNDFLTTILKKKTLNKKTIHLIKKQTKMSVGSIGN